ncbi:MAG: hypothetical protein ABFE13_01515 [Phycisphaerales bacterium]
MAEQECPWGESAETLRAVYLADAIFAALGDKEAAKEARQILSRLQGPARGRRSPTRSGASGTLAGQLKGRKK